jgi:WD40 repeat protein
VAFHPDGQRLATGSADQTIRIWDCETWRTLAVLEGHSDYVWSLAWSPEGRRLVSGSGDQTVRVWDGDSLADRRQARRQRAKLWKRLAPEIDQLFDQLHKPGQVMAAVLADVELDAFEKRIAGQIVQQRSLAGLD